ncbi:MarR family transcriptional regulator [Phaeobacter sp. PT47_59]|uniref:MarR family winged helix-turn-helix transcriptional regulator n=1 Tax=Phaeobacter sp. PT47_59 TaxID=3029979 RepID=UPI0023805E2B|nr:MarR family transcriptional regulator [Phaeobacter sp. PT47_59]MDE4175599.1 MarR family transcriptional regulator [Phaeobacter sp. PT47_59]
MTDEENRFSPETRALMGVFALYWKMDAVIDQTLLTPQMGRLEGRVLLQLDQPRRMGALAQLLLTGPPSVTAAADRLQNMGLVRRAPDPDDRRALLLQLTEQGWEMRRQLEAGASALFRQVSGLSEGEIKQFAALSMKIHDTITGTGEILKDPSQTGDKE